MATLRGNWNYPTPVWFGAGRIAELPAACRELGIDRPLLVTDPGLAALPMVAQAEALCAEAGLPVARFVGVRPNPVGANVDEGVLAYREAGCDGVIAFGGGSAIDVAKAVALMVGQSRPLWDYEDREDWWTRVDPAGVAPVVAVPTTSGTGSEVGRASVIVHEGDHRKVIIFHPKMLPARVICDPALTVGLPARLTAWVGLDALSHNLEAWCAPGFHPLADGIALQGMALVREALPDAYRDGADLAARGKMMAASLMGATAFQKGLGAMHAVSHPVGATVDSHHGLTNAVVMPYVLEANRSVLSDRLAFAARAIGLVDPTFDGFLAWVYELRAELDIPSGLSALGVTAEHIDALAPAVVDDPSAGTNPLPVDLAYARALLAAAL
jgi:alcohol dehydrogenase class IV